MGINKGYLQSNTTEKGDEIYTPFYAVDPLLKYIPKDLKLWLPFDEEWSAYYQTFTKEGYNVVRTGWDFFKKSTPEGVDLIVSNPPFSKKDQVIQSCVERGVPFCLLFPIQTLQGKTRYKYFSKLDSIQMLCFDKRIAFHTDMDFKKYTKGTSFASVYIIGGIKLLPNDLVIEELIEYERPLK